MGSTPSKKSWEQESIWRFSWHQDDVQQPQTAPDASIDSGCREEIETAARPEPKEFPVSIKTLVGQTLRIRFHRPRRSSVVALSANLESSSGELVAWLRLYGPGELVGMACREGTWSLNKRRKYGWELLIESRDGGHIGWYSGRHWFPGGTIILADGARVDLRRSRTFGWKLELSGTREVIAEISRYKPGSASVTIRSLPPEVYSDAPVVVLTACGVLMLMAVVRVQSASGS